MAISSPPIKHMDVDFNVCNILLSHIYCFYLDSFLLNGVKMLIFL